MDDDLKLKILLNPNTILFVFEKVFFNRINPKYIENLVKDIKNDQKTVTNK